MGMDVGTGEAGLDADENERRALTGLAGYCPLILVTYEAAPA
ncbi:hypothetical protein AB0O51_21265 [Streptomyces sp. NPDC090301]